MFSLLSCLSIISVFSLYASPVSAQSFSPYAYPLAVRSPYLNTWIKTNGDGNPARIWPAFWPSDGENMGWSCFVQVADQGSTPQTYSFMGNAPGVNASSLKSTRITPTQTIFVFDAGPIELTANYLSPIEPDDWVKLSFPFSYLAVTVQPTDNNAHSVRLYCDISGEWASFNPANPAKWDTVQTSKSLYHSIQRSSPQFLSEDHDMGEDGVVYHATLLSDSMTWRTGSDVNSRDRFIQQGNLENSKDSNFRNINDAFPVMALAVDLGNVQKITKPTVWAVGKARDPAIIYKGASGQQERSSYFRSKYDSISDAIDDFLLDYDNAKQRADAWDKKIQTDAGNISNNYVDLVSLATRQTIAATEITIAKGSDGNWNQSDVKMFMREMGNGFRVSPVDTMYASWPAFLYLNSSLAGRLLDPLLEYQSTPDYANDFAAANLGTAYPNATGNPVVHSQSVEQSGNMIIMALSHARASGDGSLISTYYDLLKKWADYLVSHSLSLTGQTSAEGVSLGNMTNLAIKGIIGVKAMSEISAAVNQLDDQKSYSDSAASLSKQWTSTALSDDHIESLVGDASSNGMIYNLYADVLLKTGIVDQHVLDIQTDFYLNKANNNPPRYGLPLDSNSDLSNIAKSHWTMFAAAAASKVASRNSLISLIHSRPGAVRGAFPSTYKADTGDIVDGEASPAQGAMYAFLALNVANKPIDATPLRSGNKKDGDGSKSNVGAIAGGVVGAVIAIGGLVALIVLLVRRRRRNDEGAVEYSSKYAPTPFQGQLGQGYSDYESTVPPVEYNPGSQYSYGGNQSGNNSYGGNVVPVYGTMHHGSNPSHEPYASHSNGSQGVSPSHERPPTHYDNQNGYTSSQDRSATSRVSSGGNNQDDANRIGMYMTNPHSVTSSSDSRAQPNPHVDPAAGVGRRSSTSKFRRNEHATYAPTYPPTPPSEVPSSRSDGLSSDVANQLRSEVEMLRRQMADLRQDREYDVPPPSYPDR
jgi:hypothetical protein